MGVLPEELPTEHGQVLGLAHGTHGTPWTQVESAWATPWRSVHAVIGIYVEVSLGQVESRKYSWAQYYSVLTFIDNTEEKNRRWTGKSPEKKEEEREAEGGKEKTEYEANNSKY